MPRLGMKIVGGIARSVLFGDNLWLRNGEVFAASAVGNHPVLSELVLVDNADAVTEFAILSFYN
jgi:hypothetical protein